MTLFLSHSKLDTYGYLSVLKNDGTAAYYADDENSFILPLSPAYQLGDIL